MQRGKNFDFMHCVEKKNFETAPTSIGDSNENYRRYNFQAFASIAGNFLKIDIAICDVWHVVFALTAERPVGVGQLDDRQLPARGIVHAHSPCFCTTTPLPRCYCMSNFTYVQSTSPSSAPRLYDLNALASSARLRTRTLSLQQLMRCQAVRFIANRTCNTTVTMVTVFAISKYGMTQ